MNMAREKEEALSEKTLVNKILQIMVGSWELQLQGEIKRQSKVQYQL